MHRDEILLRAVGNKLGELKQSLRPGAQTIQFPAPVVRNEISVPPAEVTLDVRPSEVKVETPVVVNLDIEPVVNALAELGLDLREVIHNAVLEGVREIGGSLRTVVMNQKAPIFQAPDVVVEAPVVNVEAVRPKRSTSVHERDKATGDILKTITTYEY